MPTVKDLLIKAFNDMKAAELKRFKSKLTDIPDNKRYHRIPRGALENKDPIDLAEKMISTYGEKEAVDVTLHVLACIDLYDLKEKLTTWIKDAENLKKIDLARNQTGGREKMCVGEEKNKNQVSCDYSLSEMESRADLKRGDIIQQLRRNIGWEEEETFREKLKNKSMKRHFSLAAQDAYKIYSNRKLQNYLSNEKCFPFDFALDVLFGYQQEQTGEGKTTGSDDIGATENSLSDDPSGEII
nr:PREDICTED: uncharacterized protein LOC102359480 [Latimeria chalumnae]|eukprot:XP_014354536.1 PREDICTED: uncharacterized protein LOC102359480 [Latimeria chalumnae]